MWYWAPIVLVYYMLYAWITKTCNDTQSWKYVGILFVCQACGLWPIIAYYSKNIVRDGIVFDMVILLGFYGGMLCLGAAKSFSAIQWIGLCLSLIGIYFMKGN